MLEKRFIDKSQILSVRISFLAKILSENNPYFIAIIRNPFVMIWRSVLNNSFGSVLSKEKRLILGIEHYVNIYKEILSQEKKFNLKIWRFEDFLEEPEKIIRSICEYIDLEFKNEIMPSSIDKIPFGSNFDAFNRKWYPIKKNINQKYLDDIPQWAIDKISQHCEIIIKRYNYSAYPI